MEHSAEIFWKLHIDNGQGWGVGPGEPDSRASLPFHWWLCDFRELMMLVKMQGPGSRWSGSPVSLEICMITGTEVMPPWKWFFRPSMVLHGASDWIQ